MTRIRIHVVCSTYCVGFANGVLFGGCFFDYHFAPPGVWVCAYADHNRFCCTIDCNKQLPWTSSSALEYVKLSRYLSYRMTFLAYLLMPTVSERRSNDLVLFVCNAMYVVPVTRVSSLTGIQLSHPVGFCVLFRYVTRAVQL